MLIKQKKGINKKINIYCVIKMKFKIEFIILIFILMPKHINALDIYNQNYINREGVQMNATQINNLRKLGFTTPEIENMSEEEFLYNKDLEGTVVASTIKYYKTEKYIPCGNTQSLQNFNKSIIVTTEITKDEFENYGNEPILTQNNFSTNLISTEYKSMYSTITSINGRYRYKNFVTWKKLPFWRTIDIIGIGIESNKVYPVSSTSYFKAYYSDSGSSTKSGIWKKTPNGCAVTFDWPSYNILAEKFYVTLYFEVDKQDENKTITVLNAYGDYSHCQGTCGSAASIGVSIGTGGLSISGSVSSKFDAISTSQATLTGINW